MYVTYTCNRKNHLIFYYKNEHINKVTSEICQKTVNENSEQPYHPELLFSIPIQVPRKHVFSSSS